MTALITLSESTPVCYVLLPLGLGKKSSDKMFHSLLFMLLLFDPHILCNNTNKPFLILHTNDSLMEFLCVIPLQVVFNFTMNDKRRSPVCNVIMWAGLFLGQGVQVCLYCQEWYAQIRCPRTGVCKTNDAMSCNVLKEQFTQKWKIQSSSTHHHADGKCGVSYFTVKSVISVCVSWLLEQNWCPNHLWCQIIRFIFTLSVTNVKKQTSAVRFCTCIVLHSEAQTLKHWNKKKNSFWLEGNLTFCHVMPAHSASPTVFSYWQKGHRYIVQPQKCGSTNMLSDRVY